MDKLSSPKAQESGTEPDLTLVTLTLDAADPRGVAALLAQYVVATRGVAGCLNVDLWASLGFPDRFVVVEKWATPGHQDAHAASEVFAGLARSCHGMLAGPPLVDVLASISAHDRA
jgi:quinol monooxygenase YgiN